MKKYTYLLLTIAILLFNINGINAITLEKDQKITITTDGSVILDDNDKDNTPQSTIFFYQTTIDSTYLRVFCEDSNLPGPADGNHTSYTIQRILDENDYVDAGLIDILKKEADGGVDRLGINVAIRMFNLINGNTKGGILYPFTTAAYINLAKDYCNGSGYEGCKSLPSIPTGFEYAKIQFGNSYKGYLDSALKAATDAKSKTSSSITGNSKVLVTGPYKETLADGTTMVTYTFTLPEISDAGTTVNYPVKNLELQKSSDKIGVLQYKDSSGNWQNYSDDKTLYETAMANGKKVTIGFTYTKSSDDDCDDLEYTLKYEELGSSKEYIAAEAEGNGSQRFLLVVKNPDGGTGGYGPKELTGAPECTPEDKKQPCSTEVSEPVCSDEQAGQQASASIHAPSDIKNCILNNEDDAHNSYKSYVNSTSSYCNIFCKEDYAEIKLNNVIEDVKCLGYFQLTARIEGGKDCYASSPSGDAIDVDGFKGQIASDSNAAVKSYNAYAENEAKKNATIDCKEYDYYCIDVPNGDVTIKKCDVKKQRSCYVHYEWETYNATINNGSVSVSSTTEKHVFDQMFIDSCASSGYTCYTVSSLPDGYVSTSLNDNHSKDAESAVSYSSTSVNSLTKGAIDARIEDFNKCSKLDGINANFNPQLEWDYYEARYNETDGSVIFDNPYTNNSFITADNKIMDSINKEEIAGNPEYCDGDVDEEFKTCKGGSFSSSASEETITYVTCSASGCENGTKNLNKTKYAKIHFDYKSDYQTKSVYYQAYPSARVANQKVNGQFASLENKLPTSSLLVGGGYFSLKIKKLGEFYESDKDLGRLLDADGDSRSIGNQTTVTKVWNGDYTCHYYSPCRPEECPTCKFTCKTGNSCEWEDCPHCETKCSQTGCLIDLGDVKASTKTISVTSLANQTGYKGGKTKVGGSGGEAKEEFREFGLNWNINTSVDLLRAKAIKTIEEIDQRNTMVYDPEAKTTGDSDLDFKITLTPSMIKKVKDYNKGVLEKGSYANDTLDCKPYKDTVNNITYENIFCYSTTISNWIKNDKDFKNNIEAPNRDNVDKYWTPWQGDYAILASDDNQIGGPSWK